MLKLLFSLIGLSIFFLLFWNLVDRESFYSSFSNLDFNKLFFAFIIVLIVPFITSLRIYFFLLSFNIKRNYNRCYKATFASLSLNILLPARGGDIIKALFLSEKKNEYTSIIGVTILERLVDITVLSLFALFSALIVNNKLIIFLSMIPVMLCIFIFFLFKTIGSFPFVNTKLKSAFNLFKNSPVIPRYVILGVLCSIASWSFVMLILYLLFQSASVKISLIETIVYSPLSIFIGLLPLSISGIGTRDSAFVYFLPSYNIEAILCATFLYTILAYWTLGILGSLFCGTEVLRKLKLIVKK